MFDKYTYKTKLIALGVVFILLLLASYKRSFSLSFGLQDEISRLDKQLELAQNANYEINQLRLELNQLNQTIGQENLNSDLVQQKILDEVSDYSENENIRIHGISETHQYATNDFDVFSNETIVEGDFISILKLINQFENNVEFSRIASCALYSEKDFKTKKIQLYAKLYLQHFKKK